MQTVSIGDNLYEMANPVSYKKKNKKKYFQYHQLKGWDLLYNFHNHFWNKK